jgi:aquaporin NIP
VRKLAGEGLATFILVLLGTGACVVDAASGGKLGALGVGLVFGLAVFAAATALGPVSGAHMNPAVTLALWRAKRFPVREIAPYVIVQILGALAGSAILLLVFGARAGDLGATHPAAGLLASFTLEFGMTLLLVLAVLRAPARFGPAAAGIIVALEAIFGGPATGASMNPARSLAPALVSGHMDGLWIYMIAPTFGALAASEMDAALSAARSGRRAP